MSTGEGHRAVGEATLEVAVVVAPYDLHQTVEQQRQSKREDDDGQDRRRLDRADEHALDRNPSGERDREHDRKRLPERQAVVHQRPRHQCRERRHLTLCEVDGAGRAVNQDEGERKARVDGSRGQSAGHLLGELGPGKCEHDHAAVPRYASITAGFARTSPGVPSAIFLPKSSTWTQPAGRFVQQQQTRRRHERAGELDALLRSVRQCSDGSVAHRGDADVVEDVVDAVLAAARMCSHLDVLEHGQPAKELDVLECARDTAPHDIARTGTQQAFAVEAHVSLFRRVEPRDHVERRRLPGTVRTDQPDDLARVGAEGDAVQRDDAAEPLRHVLNLEEGQGRSTLERLMGLVRACRPVVADGRVGQAHAS